MLSVQSCEQQVHVAEKTYGEHLYIPLISIIMVAAPVFHLLCCRTLRKVCQFSDAILCYYTYSKGSKPWGGGGVINFQTFQRGEGLIRSPKLLGGGGLQCIRAFTVQ